MCLSFRWSFLVLSFSCFSPSSTSSLPHSTCSLPGTPSSMSTPPRVKTTALTQNEEYCPIAIYNPLTSYEPKLLDDSETSAMIFQDESGDMDTDLRTRVMPNSTIGYLGWSLQAVISRASFRRPPRNGKSFFTMMSLHINNQFAKKRGIGKKLLLAIRTVMMEEHVDMVAGDFNGAAWRRPCRSERRLTSIIEEAFAYSNLPVPPGPTPLWGPGGVPGEWADVCGFVKPPESQNEWQVRLHGAFSIPCSTLGLEEKDQKFPPRGVDASLSCQPSRRSRGAVQTRPAGTLERKNFDI